MDFQFLTKRNGNNAILTISGRLDTLSSNDLAKEVKELNSANLNAIEVEMSGLNYISSSGLRCFVDLFKGCKSNGAALTITGMQPAVREIFDLTGFSKVFGLK